MKTLPDITTALAAGERAMTLAKDVLASYGAALTTAKEPGDLHRIQEGCRAFSQAAHVAGRMDLVVLFYDIIARADRRAVELERTPTTTGEEYETRKNMASPYTERQMERKRTIYDAISEDTFNALAEEALDNLKPMTQRLLLSIARDIRRATKKEVPKNKGREAPEVTPNEEGNEGVAANSPRRARSGGASPPPSETPDPPTEFEAAPEPEPEAEPEPDSLFDRMRAAIAEKDKRIKNLEYELGLTESGYDGPDPLVESLERTIREKDAEIDALKKKLWGAKQRIKELEAQ